MEIKEHSVKYNELTRTLMESYMKAKMDENIVISPMSILVLLGIVADAVQGMARDEIVDVVGKGMSYDEFFAVLKGIQVGFSESKSLMSANAVCMNDHIRDSISEGYPERLKELFSGELFVSSDIVHDVNEWVKEKTKGLIETVADESMNGLIACLMNAIAFEAEWKESYEPYNISAGEFNNADGTVTEVQMLSSSEYTYIEDDFFTGFVRPYKDEEYAFMALLPKEQKRKSYLLQAVNQLDFTKLLSQKTYGKVHARMPEFKCDFGAELTDFCKRNGINTLFTPEADFSPMSSEWLKLESIFHKAHIEVDRNGTKVTAATIAYPVYGEAICFDDKFVLLNRPFVYAIMDMKTGLPVFAGVYKHAD